MHNVTYTYFLSYFSSLPENFRKHWGSTGYQKYIPNRPCYIYIYLFCPFESTTDCPQCNEELMLAVKEEYEIWTKLPKQM